MLRNLHLPTFTARCFTRHVASRNIPVKVTVPFQETTGTESFHWEITGNFGVIWELIMKSHVVEHIRQDLHFVLCSQSISVSCIWFLVIKGPSLFVFVLFFFFYIYLIFLFSPAFLPLLFYLVYSGISVIRPSRDSKIWTYNWEGRKSENNLPYNVM